GQRGDQQGPGPRAGAGQRAGVAADRGPAPPRGGHVDDQPGRPRQGRHGDRAPAVDANAVADHGLEVADLGDLLDGGQAGGEARRAAKPGALLLSGGGAGGGRGGVNPGGRSSSWGVGPWKPAWRSPAPAPDTGLPEPSSTSW